MKRILAAVLLCLMSSTSWAADFEVTQNEFITICSQPSDTLGRTMLVADSIRITVYDSAMTELHDAWYEDVDAAAVLNTDVLCFSDNWGDINGANNATGHFFIHATVASDGQGNVDVFSNLSFTVLCIDTSAIRAYADAAADSAIVDGSALAATAGAITASTIATDAIGAAELAADASVADIGGWNPVHNGDTLVTNVERFRNEVPSAMISGNLRAHLMATATDAITAASIAADALTTNEIATGAIGNDEFAVTETVNADMIAISTDAAAANNLETMLDGTGFGTLSVGEFKVKASVDDTAFVIAADPGSIVPAMAFRGGTAHTVITFADPSTGGGLIDLTNGVGIGVLTGSQTGPGIQGGLDTVTKPVDLGPDAISASELAGSAADEIDDTLVNEHGAGSWQDAGSSSPLNNLIVFKCTVTGSATTTTFASTALTQSATDYWVDNPFFFVTGTLAGQTGRATGFTPASDLVTFTPATTSAPSIGDSVYFLGMLAEAPGAGATDWSSTEKNEIRYALGVLGTQALPSGTNSIIEEIQADVAGLNGFNPSSDSVIVDGSALAGTAGAIAAATIATDAIGAAELATDAIGAAELATDAIGAAEIATDAIGAPEIAAAAINVSEAPNLNATVSSRSTFAAATDSVIVDGTALAGTTGAIAAATIATDAIGAAELATDAIGAAELATDAIGAPEIAAAAINAAEAPNLDAAITTRSTFNAAADSVIVDGTALAGTAGAITAATIATDAIGAAEIATDAIGAPEIAAAAINSSEAPNLDAAVSTRASATSLDTAIVTLKRMGVRVGAVPLGYDSVKYAFVPATGAANKNELDIVYFIGGTPTTDAYVYYHHSNVATVADTVTVRRTPR
jgi:hypothetical protein